MGEFTVRALASAGPVPSNRAELVSGSAIGRVRSWRLRRAGPVQQVDAHRRDLRFGKTSKKPQRRHPRKLARFEGADRGFLTLALRRARESREKLASGEVGFFGRTVHPVGFSRAPEKIRTWRRTRREEAARPGLLTRPTFACVGRMNATHSLNLRTRAAAVLRPWQVGQRSITLAGSSGAPPSLSSTMWSA
jgi:hypothetical protein